MSQISLDEVCYQQGAWAQRLGPDGVSTTAVFPVDGNAAAFQHRVDEVIPQAGRITVRRNPRGLIGYLPLEGGLDDLAVVILRLVSGADHVAAADAAQLVHAVAPNRPMRAFLGEDWQARRAALAAAVAVRPDGQWAAAFTENAREQGLPAEHKLVEVGDLFAGSPPNVVAAALRDAGQVARPEYLAEVTALVDPHRGDPLSKLHTRDARAVIDLVTRSRAGLSFTEEMDERVLGTGVVPWRTEPEDIGRELSGFALKHRVRCTLLNPISTVGGLPLVRVTAGKPEHLVDAYGQVSDWPRSQREAVAHELGTLLDLGYV